MNEIQFHSFTVNSLFIYIGVVFFAVYCLWLMRKKISLSKNFVFDCAIITSLTSILSSRIFYIVLHPDEYFLGIWRVYPYFLDIENNRIWFLDKPWIFFRFWDQGFSYFGAVVGLILGLIIFTNIVRPEQNKNYLLAIYPLIIIGLIRLVNIGIIEFTDLSLNQFFTQGGVNPIYFELGFSLVWGLLLFTPRARQLGLFSFICIILLLLIYEGVFYQDRDVLFDFNTYQIITAIILVFFVGLSALNTKDLSIKIDTKIPRKKNHVATNPHLSGDKLSTQRPSKEYSLSFKDMGSKGIGSMLSQKVYAIRRRILRLFRP